MLCGDFGLPVLSPYWYLWIIQGFSLDDLHQNNYHLPDTLPFHKVGNGAQTKTSSSV